MRVKYLGAAVLCALSLCALSAYAADKPQWGSDRHVARGIPCQACHGQDMKSPEYPEEAQCVQCHNKEMLIDKTKGIQPTNPHAAPHNGDCTLCHMQHEAPVNYCEQCHASFKFNVK